MLIQILSDNPRALVNIVERTPGWVGILLLALSALGVSQMFRRRANLMRVSLAHDRAFALAVATLYGALNGLFVARTLRLLRLTRAA